MRALVLTAAVLLAAGSPLAAQQPAAPAPAPLPSIALPPEVDRVLRDYERAWQAGDAGALAALFTEDGFVLRQGHPPVQGRAAIEEAYRGAGGPLHLRALGFAVDATAGYIVGAYAGAATQPDSGKYILALRRGADGRWMIAADMDNTNQMRRPGPPPPS